MSFYLLKENLEKEGWYVAWASGYFQSDGWLDVPYEQNLDKVLFNIIQDVENYDYIEEQEQKLREKFNISENEEESEAFYDALDAIYDENQEIILKPEQVEGSHFCFSNVKTLKSIIPVIEQSNCFIDWNGKKNTRPYIYWKN